MARSAPRATQAAHFSAEPAVAKTRAPKARASWMAVVPMPLAPPWTRSDSPGGEPAALEHVVPDREEGLGQGRRPRPGRGRWGTGRHCGDRRRAVLGVAAARDERADLLADGAGSVTPAPSATTVPATSRPGMSDAPGGGAYLPSRCSRSGRFTPAAATRISTSPGPGLGRRSAHRPKDLGRSRRRDLDRRHLPRHGRGLPGRGHGVGAALGPSSDSRVAVEGGRATLQPPGHRLGLRHHAKDVALRELGEVGVAPAPADQLGEELRVARHVLQAFGPRRRCRRSRRRGRRGRRPRACATWSTWSATWAIVTLIFGIFAAISL